MRRQVFVVLAKMAVVVGSCIEPANAVVDVRFERWRIPGNIQRDVVLPVDSVSTIRVNFDATVSAADHAAAGICFAFAERDAGDNDVLARIAAVAPGGPCGALPPMGTTVGIELHIDLYCDAIGELRVRSDVRWYVTWCLEQQHGCHSGTASLPETSEPEAWEFVVLGDGDVEGSFATPEDVAACGASGSLEAGFVAPEFAENGFLGIYSDSTGIVCSDRIVPFVPFRWYIVATLDGMARCGLSLLEFGVPLPPNFLISAIPNPAASEGGSPFSRATLLFEECERGTGERIVLYTLEGIVTSPVDDVALTIGPGMPPSSSLWPYPWASICPAFTSMRRRMRTNTFFVNPSASNDCNLPVPATPLSWTAVKSLYRD